MGPALHKARHNGFNPRAGGTGLKMSIAVELPRDRASVPTVRHLAVYSLSELGVLDTIVDDVEIALSEVCTNVIDHAEFGDSYEVQISVQGDDCELRVLDSGCGFDGTSQPATLDRLDQERGRGLAIVHAVMDRVGLESRPNQGTLVTLGKHLEFASRADPY